MLALIPALLLASLPINESPLEQNSTWSCTATGVDRYGQNHLVSGPYRSSKSAAKQAAVRQCRNEGLMSCGASFCTQVAIPEAEL